MDVKRQYRDPFIVVAGDFNQWAIAQALVEFPDMRETHVGATRGDRAIDRFFSNVSRSVSASGTVPALESENSASDQLVAYIKTDLPRQETFERITYQYRHFTDEARVEFGSWIVLNDWTDVYNAAGSDEKAVAYQRHIDRAMDTFFPLRTVRKKSTDLSWINKAIKKKIKRKMEIYVKEGKSDLWRWMKKQLRIVLEIGKRSIWREKNNNSPPVMRIEAFSDW